MTMTAPACSRCGGIFACFNCEQPLRKQLAGMSEVDEAVNAGGVSGVHRYFDETRLQGLYESRFPHGPRGGAMIDFGRAIILECLVPWVDEKTGETYPFMPLPLTGRDIIHDIGRKKDIHPTEVETCLQDGCWCDSRPSGWLLTRPIVRALLNCTDAHLNDHGRQLPGAIGGSWALVYDTPTFMTQCYFDSTFILPTRTASRAARASREESRSAAPWTHAHPEHIPPRRRR